MARMTPYHRALPLHYQVEGLLRARIDADEWRPGEQIPTESELVERFRVSRTTIRAALGELERERLIVRRQGRGTFVSSRLDGAATAAITNLVLGYEAEIRVLRVEIAPAPMHAAAFLGVARGQPVRKFVRLEIVDGRPLAVVVNYMHAKLGKRIRAKDLRLRSMLELLRDRLGIALGPIRQEIEARMPDEEVASLLEIDLARPVLLVRLLVSDKRGHPVEIADTFYRADRYRYEVETPLLPRRRIVKAGMTPGPARRRKGADDGHGSLR